MWRFLGFALAVHVIRASTIGLNHGDQGLATLAVACVLWALFRKRSQVPRSKRVQAVSDLMETPLLWWSPKDPFTLRDLLNGGLCIFGRTGSGKTSSSLYQLILAILTMIPSAGGLILAASSGDRPFYEAIFEKAGLRHKLLIIDESCALRINVINAIIEAGGDDRDVATIITVLGQDMDSASGNGGGREEMFFVKGEFRMLFNASVLLRKGTGSVDAPKLLQFVSSAAKNQAQINDGDWRNNSYCNQVMRAVVNAPKSDIEEHDCKVAMTFFCSELVSMADKTRSSIEAGLLNTLHTMCTGIARVITSTTTNVKLDHMDDGGWLLIDTPLSKNGETGAYLLSVMKYLTEWKTMRRDSHAKNNPLFIVGDEILNSINPQDGRFVREGRKFGGCLIAVAQSLPGFYANMKGQNPEAQADALLGNFSTQLFHVLNCPKTAAYASSLLGKERQTFIGGTMRSETSVGEQLFGGSNVNASFNEQISETLQPAVFMAGDMRTGGKEHGYTADAICIRSGKSFSSGNNYMFVSFSQK